MPCVGKDDQQVDNAFMHGEIEEQEKVNVLKKEAKRSKNARQQL